MARRSVPASGLDSNSVEQGYFLFIDRLGGTAYDNVVCLNTFGFHYATSVNNSNTMCGPSSSPGDTTQTIDFTGEILLNEDTDEISAPDIFTLIKNGTTFSWKIGKLTPVGGDFTKTGDGFFSSYDESYSASAKGGFSATISIDGDVTQVITAGS